MELRTRRFSLCSGLLFAAAVSVLFPQRVLGEGEYVGSDFAEVSAGFQFEALQQERVCRPPTAVPPELRVPLALSTPPPLPYEHFRFDVAVVIQRHGSRRSMLGDVKSTPIYGKTHPGQLLPQGAYELHIAGIEMRWYLLHALGLWSNATAPPGSPANFPGDVYRKTLGLDLTDECRRANVSSPLCTLSNLVFSVGRQIPTDAVYARSSPVPRTLWSGLMFLEGFYGLPFGCAGTVEELQKTTGGRSVDVCLRRTACDNTSKQITLAGTLRETCTSQSLPCVHAIPVVEDGLMCGATVSKTAYREATAYYTSKGVNRTYKPRDPNVQEAMDIAASIFGEENLGKGSSWMAGEIVFSELAAGAGTPMPNLVSWVKEQKRICGEPGATCKPEQVPTYESLVKDLLNAFREGTDVQYADGQFSRYVASPAVALQNALFRFRAFGRNEDWEHLQEMLYVIGGFEGLKQEAAIQKLKMLVLSFHDFLLLSMMELLEIRRSELLPYSSRLTFELSHAEADRTLRGARPRGRNGGPGASTEERRCILDRNKGGADQAVPDECRWPDSSYSVRVLLGTPGGNLEPVALPWCDKALSCPLQKWLSYTYGRLDGHWFYEIASKFRQKYASAHAAVVGGSASHTPSTTRKQ